MTRETPKRGEAAQAADLAADIRTVVRRNGEVLIAAGVQPLLIAAGVQPLLIGAAVLHEAFIAWRLAETDAGGAPIGGVLFGQLAEAAGLERWRHKTRRFYLNLRLVDPLAQAAE